ncbi:MAG TPA: zf-TFIIB domain-containing protein [Solirubrobacterales bacterium]|nr:zf-TFIIB domain-containing protein [Solirubrobacterales bacterium]
MSEPKSELICPKCKGPMRTYARNGITIDQCTACHGIYLDRGELEQLISAERSYLGRSPLEERQGGNQAGDQPGRGFLGELFD